MHWGCGALRSPKHWALTPADVTSCWEQHMFATPDTQKGDIWGRFSCCEERELPLRSCCASAALGKAPPVCFVPARPGCARSAAGPFPSSLGAASSAEPSAASGRSGAPPAAEVWHVFSLEKQHFSVLPQCSDGHGDLQWFVSQLLLIYPELLFQLTSSACFLMMASSFCSGVLSLFRLCISSMASFPEGQTSAIKR